MTGAALRARELAVAASPVWIRLRDTFTGAAPRGPIAVRLERRVGTSWIDVEHRHHITAAGHLGFVNLGRSHDPAAIGAFDVRVHVAGRGTISETPGGDAAVTATIDAWRSDAPPAPALPTDLLLYPGPAYPFPARTPLLAGRVVHADGEPAARARVQAAATVQNTLLVEEVRSDGDGRFRLPVRWSVGATDVKATLGAQAGSITVVVPADLSTTHQITLT